MNNIYRGGIYFDNEKINYFSKAIEFMSKPKNANIATFVSAIVGGVATIIGAYFMGLM